jgi:hypothetical protein
LVSTLIVVNIGVAGYGLACVTRLSRAMRDPFSCVHHDNYSAGVSRHL